MQEYEEWLRIAAEDLGAAKVLIREEFFSSATYHCQQAAEKALKSYLSLKKHAVLKSHDLAMLVELCKKFDADFERLYDSADYLSPYATKFRYPTEFGIPDLANAEKALKCAETTLRFVRRKIAKKETGQKDIFDVLTKK